MCSITLKRENTLIKGRHWRSQKDASIIKPTSKRLTSTNISPHCLPLYKYINCDKKVKSYVKRASKLSVSAHNIEFFTFLSQFACYAFPYFYSACCHTVVMCFCTYSLFVATPLQCVSIHIPYLLPPRCNAFPYIFPICCHTVAMRFCTYSLFVATTLQHVGSKMVMQKG